MKPPHWRDAAACADAPLEEFFTPGWSVKEQQVLTRTARRMCERCPVLQPCADDADQGRDQGLRGGAYRIVASGEYQRRPLIDTAPLAPLPERITRRYVA